MEPLKSLVLSVDCLCGAVHQVSHPHKALIHFCEEGWFHPHGKMDQACFSSSRLKVFSAVELSG